MTPATINFVAVPTTRLPEESLSQLGDLSHTAKNLAEGLKTRYEQLDLFLNECSFKRVTSISREDSNGLVGTLQFTRAGSGAWGLFFAWARKGTEATDWQALPNAPVSARAYAADLIPELLEQLVGSHIRQIEQLTEATHKLDAVLAKLNKRGGQ